MKKQQVRRLKLHRETIQKLDPWLRLVGGDDLSSQCSFVCCPAGSDGCGTA